MNISSAEGLNFKNILLNLILLIIFINGTAIFSQTVKKTDARKTKTGDLIFEAEKLLSERGYWIIKIDKKKDSSTYHAIAAFQKVAGRKRNGILTVLELEAIRASTRPNPAFAGAKHIEVDLTRQVLFLVDDQGIVTHILPVSTGSGKVYYESGKKQIAYTPRGEFQITRQIKGIRRAPLGTLYDPNYFYNGVAIHGSDSIPFYPASHGCVRIPRFASKEFSNLVSVGMKVYVYENASVAKFLTEEKDMRKKTETNSFQIMPCEIDFEDNSNQK